MPTREPKSPIALAIVNGQTITTADIDPRVREEVESLEESIGEARQQVLDLQINTALLAFEAQRRGLTSQQLYDLEVTKRVVNPTESEIKTLIENYRAQRPEGDEPAMRSNVIGMLRANQEAKISEALVQRLLGANPAVMGVDIRTPNLNPAAVLATVAGKPITAEVVLERLKPVLHQLQLETYHLQKEAVDRTINDLLLIGDANRRNIAPEDIVRVEVSEKVRAPAEADVEKFYLENKANINGDLNSVRNHIASYLQEQERRRLETAMAERLRKGADVRLLFSEPQRPKQQISVDDDPSRGDPKAPVTIVEFTDFQCPACAAMHPILEEVLKAYENKVRLVVRDFPLTMHKHARKAAEAANAAHAQGKFFEYAALLFKRQKALDVPSLKKYATELGLDRVRFDTALDKGTYAAEVRHDLSDGEVYGVDSTPSIFVNGVLLTTFSADGLRAAIDRALAEAPVQKAPPQ
ncbi:MAG: thioredoxin domain-containing protein [Pyrinomonadaceae bacterium]